MYMNYDVMIANMEAERNKANDDLQYYRRFTAPMHNGFTRKQMIRQLTNRKRMCSEVNKLDYFYSVT